jgi:nitrate/nitrite transporter NarK
MILYLTFWFPSSVRAGILGVFIIANPASTIIGAPLSTVIGAPVSGLLLGLDGAFGLRGWQWLFILEAIPALVMSAVVLVYLTDHPADATWLDPEGRRWLVSRLERERRQRESVRHFTVRQALVTPKVLALGLVYFGAVATNYGLSFFLPQIVKGFGLTNAQAGFVAALPYAVGLLSVWWGHRSDRTLERRWHVAFPLLVAAAGLAVSTAFDNPVLKMAALSVAGFGIFSCLPVFWTLPAAFLSGPAAAGAIALINSIGNLAGFAGPYAVGRIRDATGSYTGGLLLLSGLGLLAMVIVLALRHDRSLEQVP